MKRIVALVGETGAGKDIFCEYAKRNFRLVYCLRFSDSLNEVLKIFSNDIKKEDQQWLAQVLRGRFGNNILGEAIAKKIKGGKQGIIILNGIRALEEAKMIKGLGGKIVYITADSFKRWQRVKKRGEKKDDKSSYKKFLEMEKVKTELLIKKIGSRADFKIENNSSKKDFKRKIKEVLKEII